MTDERRTTGPDGFDPEEPVELTAAEREALDALPRETDPGQLLEERTVRALRENGLLATSRASGITVAPPAHSVAHGRPWWRSAAAIAAGIALFAGGMSIGQMLGSRQTAEAFQTVFEEGDVRLASQVQRAGSEYVAALEALADVDGAAADSGQALEVALTALWAAANEIVRLAPDDPLAARILQGFEARAGNRGEYRQVNQLLVEF
jgi:hypothetical protein